MNKEEAKNIIREAQNNPKLSYADYIRALKPIKRDLGVNAVREILDDLDNEEAE